MSGFRWSSPQRSQQLYCRAGGLVAVPWADASGASTTLIATAAHNANSTTRERRSQAVPVMDIVHLLRSSY